MSVVREWGVPEATPTVKTPRRGGRHFYLRGRGPTRTGCAPGVDLRGRGGYAVGAGARRGDGMYEWAVPPWEVDEAGIPSELERLIRELTRRSKPPARTVVTKGDRNNYLTRVGGSMARVGMDAEAIRAGLHGENVAKVSAAPAAARGRPDRQELREDGRRGAVGPRPVAGATCSKRSPATRAARASSSRRATESAQSTLTCSDTATRRD